MLLIQIYTVIFSIALAWFNKIPCKKMINYGASLREEKEWHKVNAVIKLVFAGIITSYNFNGLWMTTVTLFLVLLIQWAVFDIVLSKLLHGSFWYLGKTSAIDKRFRTFFGVDEGLIKFLIVCVIILIINFYL